MSNASNDEPESPFPDFEERIAAQARQLFRAVQADDAKAVEVTLFYFRGFLVKVLARHLRDNPEWNSNDRWLDGLGGADPEITPPNMLRFRDLLVWATRDQRNWYVDPFEFELKLCSETGAFHCYTFRFGDHRSLEDKKIPSSIGPAEFDLGIDGWAFLFQRKRKGREKGTS